MHNNTNTLNTLGYHIERNLLSKQLINVINNYFLIKAEIEGDDVLNTSDNIKDIIKKDLSGKKNPHTISRDQQVIGSMTIHGDPLIESLLSYLTPVYSEIAGFPLVPTYAFFRYYNKGQVLDRHHDRIECEFSATVPIGYSDIWPISLEDLERKDKTVDLEIGDILFYQGCAVPHWRDEFKGEWAHQTFLHWMSEETAKTYPQKIFDGRLQLGVARKRK